MVFNLNDEALNRKIRSDNKKTPAEDEYLLVLE
jgi:hypothetical protein